MVPAGGTFSPAGQGPLGFRGDLQASAGLDDQGADGRADGADVAAGMGSGVAARVDLDAGEARPGGCPAADRSRVLGGAGKHRDVQALLALLAGPGALLAAANQTEPGEITGPVRS